MENFIKTPAEIIFYPYPDVWAWLYQVEADDYG